MIDGSRYAVIDIGSNSVRLVVFGGPLRAPSVLFNEKVMAGLGRTKGGALDPAAMERTLVALARFRSLAALFGIDAPHTVATAAVRDATNGTAFLAQTADIGLNVTLLSGEAEAEAAGYGVIAGFDQANGIVGDLGGGSLELARVADGQIVRRISFPLGVLRLPEIRAQGAKALDRHFAKLLKDGGWDQVEKGLPFFLVGGSWRALGKIHAHLTQHPLPILHNYIMPLQAAARIARAVARFGRSGGVLEAIVSGSRRPAMADAAAMLVTIVNHLKPSSLIVSTTGVREGLVYQQLLPAERQLDPLIVAARVEAQRQGRFAEHGDLLFDWLNPIFAGESADEARLRHVACLLGDIGWAANPDFRAERGLEFTLHGNWHGIDARGRAMVAQALFTAFGGGAERPKILGQLASPENLDRARLWGLAIRLAQRLSGGTAAPLNASAISASEGVMTLHIAPEMSTLIGEAVTRRFKQCATAMGMTTKILTK
jgi:exopolyphosphatase / guanosine-5'-triphosphate,3'-diphosphate pyrophosphatase